MNEIRILELLGNANEEYINEANPQNKYVSKFRVHTIAVAACLCLLVIAGLGIFHHIKTSVKENYYATNLEEVSSIYEGVLLVESLSYEDAMTTDMLLCYSGDGLPVHAEDWKTLTVSANYEDCDLIMNCAFNGETFAVKEEDVTDVIQYGGTTIRICEAETATEYDLAYYAVFEYENVCYELRMYSNDKRHIYDILEAILGVPGDAVEENFTDDEGRLADVLGYSDYHVKVEQSMPGFMIQKYYVEEDGTEKCIAEVYGYAVPGPEVYSKDLDGDGINELICNCMAGTGAERVYIYRNSVGVVERGYLSYDLWDDTLFPGISNRGSSYIQERYNAETNQFEIGYPIESGYESIILENMDMFEFEEFTEEF